MRLDRIVIGVDFGAASIAGARWAAGQLAPDAELVLVNAVDLPSPAPFLRRALPPVQELAAAARDHAERCLGEIARSLPSASVRTLVKVGRAHEVLADTARDLGAQLLVVGPHGDRARVWKPLGTTAERLVRAATIPVLVAANPRAAAPRRILVPVDESEITPYVLAAARGMATHFDADVTVVHVLANAVASHAASLPAQAGRSARAPSEALADVMTETATRWLEELAVRGHGGERVSAAVTVGAAPDAILALAESIDTDLIVMGRSGAGTLRAASLGGTVGTVLHGARCPVLVVTEPEIAPTPPA